MKKNFILSISCAFIFLSGLRAQTRYAYLPGGKTSFQTSVEKIIVKYKKGTATDRLKNYISDKDLLKPAVYAKWEIFTLKDPLKRSDSLRAILNRAFDDSDIVYANPFLIYKDGTLQGLTDQVLVRLKTSTDIAQLSGIFEKLAVKTIEKDAFIDRQYLLTVVPSKERDALDIANALYETGLFDFSEPDFIKLNVFKTNDPDFFNQWGLQNTGQYGGAQGADVKASQAWALSTGTGIKVAVLDLGVDLVHPDLQANLLPGVDELTGITNGAPVGDDAHGTACAGIIGAIANNGYGVTGVAYNSKIIPVRIGVNGAIDNNAAVNGINWAASAAGGNADVLSCSWGGGAPSAALNLAIATALVNGRGGKGSVLVFSSGDDGGGTLVYPASQPGVIAVGATNMCDQRVIISNSNQLGNCNYDTRQALVQLTNGGGSNYGTGLGVVAPGINIATTDISGPAGFNNRTTTEGWQMYNNDYVNNFDGTSASTAFAAGVIALILSANPCLTYTQATAILESSADKVGGYSYSTNLTNGTWNNQMGYGRINAFAALTKAVQYPISGVPAVCTSATYSIANVPANATVAWSINNMGSTLSVTPGANNTAIVTNHNYYTATGTLSAAVTVPGSCSIITSNFPITAATPSFTTSGLINQGPCFGSEVLNNASLTIGPPNFIYDYCPAIINCQPTFGSNGHFTLLSGSPSSFSSSGDNLYLTLNGAPVSVSLYQYTGGGCPQTNIWFMPRSDSKTQSALQDTSSVSAYQLNPVPTSGNINVLMDNHRPFRREGLGRGNQSGNAQQDLAGGSGIRTIKIFDVAGRLRKSYQYRGITTSVQLDLSDLGTGIYFAEIFNGQTKELKKIIVQH